MTNSYYHSHDETITPNLGDYGLRLCRWLLTNKIKPLMIHREGGGIEVNTPKKRKYAKGSPRKRQNKIKNNEVIL